MCFAHIEYDHRDIRLFDTVNLPSYIWVFLFVITHTMQSNKMIWRLEHLNFHLHWCGTLCAECGTIKSVRLWPGVINTQMKFRCVAALSTISAGKWPLRDMEPLTNICILHFTVSKKSTEQTKADTLQHLLPNSLLTYTVKSLSGIIKALMLYVWHAIKHSPYSSLPLIAALITPALISHLHLTPRGADNMQTHQWPHGIWPGSWVSD